MPLKFKDEDEMIADIEKLTAERKSLEAQARSKGIKFEKFAFSEEAKDDLIVQTEELESRVAMMREFISGKSAPVTAGPAQPPSQAFPGKPLTVTERCRAANAAKLEQRAADDAARGEKLKAHFAKLRIRNTL